MKQFWSWYQRHYKLNLTIATFLFGLQIVHLFWLATHVIWARLFGYSLFQPSGPLEWLIIVVDYTEIPALITTSLVYIHQLREKFSVKPLWFLFSLGIQVVHMFWITDEFVLSAFSGDTIMIPAWLAWVAILIDYLEVPVIVETVRLFLRELKKGKVTDALKVLSDKD